MNFLSLNIQGLAQKAKKDWIKELCVKNKVNFIALQETKMENNDYFVMIRGVWCLTGNDLLIIAVYAPHDCRDKQMLWDYLTYEIGKWKGEVVIMGDFNEKWLKKQRLNGLSKGTKMVDGNWIESPKAVKDGMGPLDGAGVFFVASVRKIIDDKSLSDVDSKTRGIDIDSIMCAICDNGVETSRHLFFYCCMVRQNFRKITRWWDVPYVEVESYED
ncbi:RNA-directed DNA polymerase, eukaryota, partial [Tanacetum coccineum]